MNRDTRDKALRAGLPRQLNWRLVTTMVLLSAFYLPSLSFGYLWDDRTLVGHSFPQMLEANERIFRPLWYLSYPIVDLVSRSPAAHRLTNLLLLGLCLYQLYALLPLRKHRELVVLAVFLHPAFIYPVTWISQRNDLLLILAILLSARAGFAGRSPLAAALLSTLVKSPYLFHTIYFSAHQWRRRHKSAAIVILAAAAAVFLMGFRSSYWSLSTGEASLWAGLHDMGLPGYLLIAAARVAKIGEGVLLTFIPFPAFYESSALPISLICYPLVWIIASVAIFRSRPVNAPNVKDLSYLALLCAIPFAVTSSLRVTAPCVVFSLAATLVAVRPRRLRAALAATLIALNLFGSLLNYSLSDTAQYDLQSVEPWTPCTSEVPMEAWDCDRKELLRTVLPARE